MCFLGFFENLAKFWKAWALQKFEKIAKKRISNVLSFEGWFWEGSGTVWEWFFDGFGLILKGFGIDFWSFVGGFGGISDDYKLWRLQNLLWWLGQRGADQWMDGEDLIICVAIWTLYKRRPPLLSDDLRVRCIASRNRLRFASLRGAIFRDFGAIFGGFGS